MSSLGNIGKMIDEGRTGWELASSLGLSEIRTVSREGNYLTTTSGHRFINMCSCSYLGLNRNTKIIDGAIKALQTEGTMSTSVSKARVAPLISDDVEAAAGDLFDCKAILTGSCYVASGAVLPVLASGQLTGGERPHVIFDRNSHFSMSAFKPVCGNETTVHTCDHNDLNYIEAACKNHRGVAYVADGAYSMGGESPTTDLLYLQEKYGLFLYIDDSHSISLFGEKGKGITRSTIGSLGEKTIVVGSLAKAFGATGGIIMTGSAKIASVLTYFGGPLGWSQMLNAASIGAIQASIEIHRSQELITLQNTLQDNLKYFDSLVTTETAGTRFPVRIIDVESIERAGLIAQDLYENGFYAALVFFPIVAKGRCGLRIMPRADMTRGQISEFSIALDRAIKAH